MTDRYIFVIEYFFNELDHTVYQRQDCCQSVRLLGLSTLYYVQPSLFQNVPSPARGWVCSDKIWIQDGCLSVMQRQRCLISAVLRENQGTVNSLSKAIIAQLLDCGNINYKNYTLVTKH